MAEARAALECVWVAVRRGINMVVMEGEIETKVAHALALAEEFDEFYSLGGLDEVQI